MNTTRLLIVLTSLALAGLVWHGIGGQGPGESVAETPAAAERAGRAPDVVVPMPPEHEVARRDRIQREEAAKQVEAMRRLQTERAQREQAAADTHRHWEELRMRNEWKMVDLVRTNLDRFYAMKQAAGLRSRREVTCELCGGDELLDLCVVCDRSGKCPTCLGSGRQRVDPELPCPTCEGRKKCFLCAGRKRMKCNFCEDGKVSNIARPPSTRFDLP